MELKTRDELVRALRDAAELEHQLMVQYLYSGFSLVKGPYGTTDGPHCTHAQYEAVRRWSSTLFMVARQEMEHLSLANAMLTAIGAEPHLGRENLEHGVLLSPYFTSGVLQDGTGIAHRPKPFPYAFTRFDEDTAGRFVCGESPPFDKLPAGRDPIWCFFSDPAPPAAPEPGSAPEPAPEPEPPAAPVLTFAAEEDLPMGRSHLAPAAGDDELAAVGDDEAPVMVGGAREVSAGTVQDLYMAIREAFETIHELEFPHPAPEVEVPVEYNVFVFAVTDRTSAVAAVDLILEQGEGLADPWNLDSHFRRFFEIHEQLVDMQLDDELFDPAYPLVDPPSLDHITHPLTRELFGVVNEAYGVLLLILASLYERAVPAKQDVKPFLSTALSQNAFAPAMTMIIRALNEILVLLPIDEHGGDARTGSNWWIADDVQQLVAHPRDPELGKIDVLLERWEHMTQAIAAVAETARRTEDIDPGIAPDLHYVFESSTRTGANIRQTYEHGLYEKFVEIGKG